MCAHGICRQGEAVHACPNARVSLCEPSRSLEIPSIKSPLCSNKHDRSAPPRTHVQRARDHSRAAHCARTHSGRAHVCADGGADDRVSATICLHPCALRRQRALRCRLARRLGSRHLDVRHLRAHPRRSQPLALQRRVVVGFRLPGCTTIRIAAIHGFHGAERCRRRRRASPHPFRRIVADGRRLGCDFRSDGRGDTVCVPARRSARTMARSRRGVSGTGSAACRQPSRSARDRGLLAGLLAFSAFDPVPSSSAPNGGQGQRPV